MRLSWIVALAISALAVSGRAAESPIRRVELSATAREILATTLSKYEAFSIDPADLARQAKSGRLDLHLGEISFLLEVELFNVRTPDYKSFRTGADGRRVEDTQPPAIYRGRVAFAPESRVLLVARPGLFEGSVEVHGRMLMVEPLARRVPGGERGVVLVYDAADEKLDSHATCAADSGRDRVALSSEADLRRARALAKAGALEVRVATDADAEQFAIYGEETDAHIELIIAGTSEVFEQELGFALVLGEQYRFEDPAAQPYRSLDPAALLGEFSRYWNAERDSVDRDLVHLFTGKKLDGTTIGIATVGTVWEKGTAYGLSTVQPQQIQLAAHEIGHNFGGNHDCEDCICLDCSFGTGPILCPCLQRSAVGFNFSDRSQCEIATFVDGHQP